MFPHYFQVVKVAEVEVVTMTATMVESIVMITMIWTLDLHLAVLHLVVLVEIGLFVCLNPGFISEYFRDLINGYMARPFEYSTIQKCIFKIITMIFIEGLTLIAIEEIKILGAVLKLPSVQHCQFSPFVPFLW